MLDQRAVLTLVASLAVVVLAAFFLGTAGEIAKESVAPGVGQRRVVPGPPEVGETAVVDLVKTEVELPVEARRPDSGITFSGTVRTPVAAGPASITLTVGDDLSTAESTADDDGRFSADLDVPSGERVRVSITARGCAPVDALLPVLPRGMNAYPLGEFSLPPGGVVSARVQRKNGDPVVGRSVSFSRVSGDSNRLLQSVSQLDLVTDANGFVASTTPVDCGPWRYVVSGPDGSSVADTLVVEPGAGPPVSIVLEGPNRQSTILGRVVDGDGEPVVRALVVARDETGAQQASALTSPSGGFGLVRSDPDVGSVHVGVAQAVGFDPKNLSGTIDWGVEGLTLVLTRSRPLQLEVVEAESGHPVREFDVAWFVEHEASTTLRGKASAPTRWVDGVCVVDAVPAGRVRLVVTPEDPTLAPNVPLEVEVLGVASQRVRVELPSRRPITVRAVHADGHPAIGSRVELLDPSGTSGSPLESHAMSAAKRAQVVGSGPYSLLCDVGTTGEDGTIALEWRADGAALAVRVTGSRHLPALAQRVVVNADGATSVVEVEVGDGVALKGRVTPIRVLDEIQRGACRIIGDDGHSLILTYVGESGWKGRWARRTVEIDPLGSFEVDGLAPGPWSLQFRADYGHNSYTGAGATKDLGIVDVPTAASLELDISDLLPARLSGNVRVDDERLADTAVQLVRIVRPDGADADARGGEVTVQTDAKGDFRARRLRPGTYMAIVDGGPAPLVSWASAEVEPGSDGFTSFRIRTGELHARIVDSDGAALGDRRVEVVDLDAPVRVELRTDADGVVRCPRISAGRYRMTVDGATAADPATELEALDVAPGPAPFPVELKTGSS
ncbi:MAG: carboxypeptidase-like regulatory domain-containing protein [Planctomycetota bacterium]